ncbi:MAG TPA: type I-C CRISPR-associated endonuclease Cas1c [Chloroflexota bacterium]
MELHNWLYVQDERASLHLDHDAIRIRATDGASRTLPLLALEGIACFGAISVSPALIERCASDGRSLVFLTTGGKFQARVEGPCRGNVLLRRAQHSAAASREASLEVARTIVAGKIQATRQVLQRGARERFGLAAEELDRASLALAGLLGDVAGAPDVNVLRGFEGEAASIYFHAFNHLVLDSAFRIARRERRPPRDPMNALLSFLYTLVLSEVVAAIETTGLDPQVGFLHELRPGRPALALDLMEELRAPIADRLALALVNRRQIEISDFVTQAGGSVQIGPRSRRIVLEAYQSRKRELVQHRLLGVRLPWALIPHAQTRILARHLRGDLPIYIPFLTK